MKRLVPFVIVLAVAASVAFNCAGHDQFGPKNKSVCGDDASKIAHQLKYTLKDGKPIQEVDGGCPSPCPGNSPLVNSFPINGLDIAGSGVCSPERVRVDPNKAGKPKKCSDGDVKFVAAENRLEIVNKKGETCAGSDLQDASFTVTSDGGHVKLTIKEVAQIPFTDPDTQQQGSGSREGYRIVASKVGPKSESDVSVCNPARSVEIRKVLGLPNTTGDYTATGSGAGSGSAEPYAEYAIALPGPLYSNHVTQINFTTNFFNLACATDALAKRTLNNVTTASDPDDTQFAALRMLTATYCNRPRTARNRRIHFVRGSGKGSGSGSAEAWWTAMGATCLANVRLQELGDFASVNLGSDLIPADCGSNQGHEHCASWMDYAKAVRDECAAKGSDDDPVIVGTDCNENDTGVDFKSYLPTDGGSNGQSQIDSPHGAKHY